MTDDQFERIKKGLNFHSEGGVYNLCTLTETALRTIIEDAVKFYEKQQKIDALHIVELQKQKGELTDKVKTLEEALKGYKKIATWCDNCEQLKQWKEEWQEQVQKATDEGYARTLQTIQLTKAKEIIHKVCYEYGIYDKDLMEEAKQFLNSEVEK